MTTTLQRLLKHPHAAVFDKSPVPELALRLRHANNVQWGIAEGLLTATVGAVVSTYDLRTLTVAQLADDLQGDGFEVLSLSQSMSGLSAMVLVEGSGAQLESNGDRIEGFTSLLWALLSSFTGELRDAKTQIGYALDQMVITQAEGEWLDLWGALYAEPRRVDESDADYAPRVPREAFRERVNALAIEKAILDATGEDVRIREPWKYTFILDESTLSGPHRMYDGETIGYHLIQPVATDNVDWAKVLPVVHRNRAAGVLVLAPQTNFGVVTDADTPVDIHFGGHSLRFTFSLYEDRALLDYGEISDVALPNHESRKRRELLRASGSAILEIYPDQFNGQWVYFGGQVVSFGAPQPPIDYVVHVGHGRDYRVVYVDVQYVSQYWTPLRTWATAGASWSGLNAIIDAGHNRPDYTLQFGGIDAYFSGAPIGFVGP